MKNVVFCSFLFFYSFGTFSQQIVRGIPNSILFVGGYAKPKTKIQVNRHTFSGILVSNAKDTLHGEFKFINQEAVLWKPVGEDEFKELSLKNAYYIKLEGTDKTLIKEQYTEFFKFEDISKYDILRKIGTNSGVNIYDNTLFVDEISGYINTAYIVLEDVKTGRRKQFPNFWNGNTKRAMIRFYNEATGKKIPYSQFRNYGEFVRFLLAEK
jgi:hypothetical protein